MADDLVDLHERLEYCRFRTESLAPQVSDFNANQLETRVIYRPQWLSDPRGPSGTFWAIMKSEVPISIKIETRMLLNEYRAVLDTLACRLARRNGDFTDESSFPVAETPEKFADRPQRLKIRALSQADQDRIRDLQQFSTGDLWLPALHTADLKGKHRDLLGCSGAGMIEPSGSGFVGHLHSKGGAFLQVGVEVAIGTFAGVTTPIAAHVEIVFQDPPLLAGWPIISTLHDLRRRTEQTVSVFD